MSRARAVAGLAAALGFFAGGMAFADTPPTVWQKAKDPTVGDAFALHREVERRLAAPERLELREPQVMAAKAMLERAKAQASPHAFLRFDLATVYFILHDYDRAAAVLKGVLADAPDDPAAEEGWLRLAFACGHVGDHVCEQAAYTEVLRRTTEDAYRATPTLNLAETEMHLGHLKEAVDGYREAVRLAGRFPSRETAPLAMWGLAVALDRSGDRPAAEREARFAVELERSMGLRNLLRSTDVFFVPSYEVFWYEGLGAIALARTATSPKQAARLWRIAEESFGAYVKAAEPAKDRWLALAKVRLAACTVERERAVKRTAKEPEDSDEDDALQ